MVQEYIEIRGARENNLKEVSLRLPKRNLIMFTGVSGSGKSSVVFDTIANEAQRLLFENFSLFISGWTCAGRHPGHTRRRGIRLADGRGKFPAHGTARFFSPCRLALWADESFCNENEWVGWLCSPAS
jgi:hypothetical protein